MISSKIIVIYRATSTICQSSSSRQLLTRSNRTCSSNKISTSSTSVTTSATTRTCLLRPNFCLQMSYRHFKCIANLVNLTHHITSCPNWLNWWKCQQLFLASFPLSFSMLILASLKACLLCDPVGIWLLRLKCQTTTDLSRLGYHPSEPTNPC